MPPNGRCRPPDGGRESGRRRLFSAAAVVIGAVTSRCLTAPVVRTSTIREQASGHRLIMLQDKLIRSRRNNQTGAIFMSRCAAGHLALSKVADLHSRIVSR